VIERAQENPHHLTLVFIAEDNTEEEVSAERFHNEAVVYSQALQDMGVGPEDLVILVLQHSRVLLSAFWGALYLGAIPSIFPFLTEKLDPELYMQRIRILVGHSGAKVVITFPEFKGELEALLSEADCLVLSTDEVPEPQEGVSAPPWEDPSGDQLAFLQHSSGTTGLQKGVALSHHSVLNQIVSYSKAIDLRENDVVVSWLPLYHDMGLIAGFVMPIVAGIPLVLISPFHWVRDPKSLLWAIHRHKGTLCWLPNFAYNHMPRSIRKRDLEGLDLSSWRMTINCSEPVYHRSHQDFLKKFGPRGIKEETLATSYAMAENTFAVTQSAPGVPPNVDWVQVAKLQAELHAVPGVEGDEGVVSMVSNGPPIENTEVAIWDEEGNLLSERRVGEVYVRSNCMLSGYYRRPDLTGEVMKGGWYATGDMVVRFTFPGARRT
jgi:acyl-CoA synthetase (AMP-forming)/AMP-acid ligase II